MADLPYSPWKKGPAEILPFPKPWLRAWLVCLVDGDQYRGEIVGEDVPGPQATENGPHDLVMTALRRPDVRHGLPIIPCWRVVA